MSTTMVTTGIIEQLQPSMSCGRFTMTGNCPHAAEFPIMLKQPHDTNTYMLLILGLYGGDIIYSFPSQPGTAVFG